MMGRSSLFHPVHWTLLVAMLFACGCHQARPAPVLTPPVPPPTALSNVDVLNMTANGVSDDVIIRSIQNQPPNYDVSPNSLIQLRNQGVSDQVVQAMQVSDSQAKQIAVVAPPTTVIQPAVHVAVPVHRRYHHRRYHHRHHGPRFGIQFSSDPYCW